MLFDKIALYDGSVYPDRTKGEVSAVCDKEEMNILSLNLFHEILDYAQYKRRGIFMP